MTKQLRAPDTTQLASRLRISNARLFRRLRKESRGEQSASVISALAVLSRLEPTTLGELAEAEGVSRPSMTVMAAALERDGLMAREKDPADGRLVRVRITPKGREALARSRNLKNAYLARRLRSLYPEELSVLERAAGVLERLLEDDR